jgi:hypothetical protein
LIFTTVTLSLRCLGVILGGAYPCLFFAELVHGNSHGETLLPSGLIALARWSGGIGVMNRFVVALVVGLGLRDDSSLEESSTGNALLFQLGLFRLGLGLGFNMIPTDDSSLEESTAGTCITTPPLAMALAVAIASLDHVCVAVVVGGDNVVVGGAKFMAAAHSDKEGNADVGLVDVNPTDHDGVP